MNRGPGLLRLAGVFALVGAIGLVGFTLMLFYAFGSRPNSYGATGVVRVEATNDLFRALVVDGSEWDAPERVYESADGIDWLPAATTVAHDWSQSTSACANDDCVVTQRNGGVYVRPADSSILVQIIDPIDVPDPLDLARRGDTTVVANGSDGAIVVRGETWNRVSVGTVSPPSWIERNRALIYLGSITGVGLLSASILMARNARRRRIMIDGRPDLDFSRRSSRTGR